MRTSNPSPEYIQSTGGLERHDSQLPQQPQQMVHATHYVITPLDTNRGNDGYRIIATVIKRDKTTISKVRSTWENALKKTWALPNGWIQN